MMSYTQTLQEKCVCPEQRELTELLGVPGYHWRRTQWPRCEVVERGSIRLPPLRDHGRCIQ